METWHPINCVMDLRLQQWLRSLRWKISRNTVPTDLLWEENTVLDEKTRANDTTFPPPCCVGRFIGVVHVYMLRLLLCSSGWPSTRAYICICQSSSCRQQRYSMLAASPHQPAAVAPGPWFLTPSCPGRQAQQRHSTIQVFRGMIHHVHFPFVIVWINNTYIFQYIGYQIESKINSHILFFTVPSKYTKSSYQLPVGLPLSKEKKNACM